MIVGIGVDVVDVTRFERSVSRAPALLERLFADGERMLPVASLAARFAAKEALLKALGEVAGFRWTDMAVVGDRKAQPEFSLIGSVAAAAASRDADRIHLSMSHDAGVAVAMVVLESAGRGA